MNVFNDIYRYLAWQSLVFKVQEHALKMPELGINTDCVPFLVEEELLGLLAFLERSLAEKRVL